MIARTLRLLLLFNIPLAAAAQHLAGRVVAAGSEQPVPFATVGIKGQPVGTTADEAGRFAFAPAASLSATDSVVISCVGYRSLRLPAAALRQAGATYLLTPVVQTLREVQVRHGQVRPATLGGKVERGTAHWNTAIRDVSAVGADERGWEVATVLPVRRSCYLDGFNLYIEENQFRQIRLRFMLYAVEHGQPTRLLLTDDIQFMIPSQQTGWTNVDLRGYNLHLERGQTVAAGIQWLQGEPLTAQSHRFGGPATFPALGHRTLVRDKSEARWRSYPANAGMYLDVQEYD
ncbi:carboxypeptidase-like regulatory domain-containing protein [Hymenobacter sp. CRA2]|uniref:carboxypeptidase-like regulatory domain-containing protein n=1 Tax=Hymenobacter sp. CRA2 TaxID=1955620 RepID=UPI0009C85615|nr:carboxypeptidase-like regulatory domain-containing protein [Hymenobacter sp. CRA2]OON70004.1 hypothetical protein B0919_04460 [Hymenobacter sp. CRA2]